MSKFLSDGNNYKMCLLLILMSSFLTACFPIDKTQQQIYQQKTIQKNLSTHYYLRQLPSTSKQPPHFVICGKNGCDASSNKPIRHVINPPLSKESRLPHKYQPCGQSSFNRSRIGA